jgi:hypothetical protein
MAFNGVTNCVVRQKTKSLGCVVTLRNEEVKPSYKLQILGRKIISYALVCVLKNLFHTPNALLVIHTEQKAW